MKLAKWAANQKYLHSKGRLSQDRAHKLAALPGWEWSTRLLGAQKQKDDNWQMSYQDLLQWPQHSKNLTHEAQPRN